MCLSGEIMHSRTPPMDEANRLYIEQSFFAERVRAEVSAEPLVIWDVGLGAAANAMAAIRCYEAQAANGPVRPMHIISFENDLDSLRLAFEYNELFHVSASQRAAWDFGKRPLAIPPTCGVELDFDPGEFSRDDGAGSGGAGGDFYDMFSGKTNGDQWTLEAFRRLAKVCQGHGAELFTYTVSTASRAALLVSGFHAAKGRSTGDKTETTIAFTPEAYANPFTARHELLGADWLGQVAAVGGAGAVVVTGGRAAGV